MQRIRRHLLIVASQGEIDHSFNIISDSSYTGKFFYCTCLYDGEPVSGTWAITSGGTYATINSNGRVDIIEGTSNKSITITCTYLEEEATVTITVSYDNQLTIECSDTLTGTSGNAIARYNSTVVTPTWSIISGGAYASIDNTGAITITDTGSITIQATYSTYTATRTISVIYDAGTTSQTTVGDDGSITTETTTTSTDPETGAITETTTSQTVNEDGSTSSTSTETVTNEDGSATTSSTTTNSDGTSSETQSTTSAPDPETGTIISSSETVHYDENGDVAGSSENNTTIEADGSSASHTTNYDENGDPTDANNVLIDTTGNVNTQDIEYDDGEPVVTGYDIDTEASDGDGKELTGTGVNTEFVPFRFPDGFVLHIKFRTAQNEQPNPPIVADKEDPSLLYNIMSAKSTTKVNNVWPGFDIRWSTTILQFRRTLVGESSSTSLALAPYGIDDVYDLLLVYNPNDLSNKFALYCDQTNQRILNVNKLLQDNIDLELTLGYAINMQGQPYRYSNVTIYDFNVARIQGDGVKPATPVITCDGTQVFISTTTDDCRLYYQLGGTGSYFKYTGPIAISEDTTVKAFALKDGLYSTLKTTNCVYSNGTEDPVISCDGVYVTLSCVTAGATIYYKLDNGSYAQYSTPIHLTDNATVYAYATKDGVDSNVVSQACTYNSGIATPVIVSDGQYVNISCDTQNTVIYYKIDDGVWEEYLTTITLEDTVTISAYATMSGEHSPTATQTCTYISGTTMPVITCENNIVTITCSTQGATIYYREGASGEFSIYNAPIHLSATEVVYAYATLNGNDSAINYQTCTYVSPVHDYSLDYLTFKVIDGGTICWKALGSGATKTIQWQKNNDTEWTSITSTAAGVTITVQANDEVRFKGSETTYCKSNKSNYSGFEGGTATYDIQGNIMSLVAGDNFASVTTLPASWCFCSLFKKSGVHSAENLILPATTLTSYCYRALFSYATSLQKAPALPATTLAQGCYWYMFEYCAIEEAPVLAATTISQEAYGHMFENCANLRHIKCLATTKSASKCLENWVTGVAVSGVFVKADGVTWATGTSGIPTGWTEIGESEEGYEEEPDWDISEAPVLRSWKIGSSDITLPYSVNAIDSHSSNYSKNSFNFYATLILDTIQPTYIWFQHADQTADIYINDVKVTTHWGGYNAFFTDITNYISVGKNDVKVVLNNTTRTTIAPAAGDFNFSATLGEVRLWTSPVLPDVTYGYDGFHILTTWNNDYTVATTTVTTSVPSDLANNAEVTLTISDVEAGGNYTYTETKQGKGTITFTHTESVSNLTLWQGIINPYLYNFKIEVSYGGTKYHTFTRDWGFRYYHYAINEQVDGAAYTGFLLNGQKYYLRGVCMHCDKDGRANALTQEDFAGDFALIQDLGCNFIRTAHYPHPKEVYDWCDKLGIIVQTEVPCVNKFQTTMPQDYYDHLFIQYADMVNQHYNHPSIIFWGLANEITTDDKTFAKTQLEAYITQIKTLDPERWVGYVLSHSYDDPSNAMGNPACDWFGGNLYVGWYINKPTSETTKIDPTNQIQTRITKTVTNRNKPFALSEYGCGGTQHCHSDDPKTTTTTGNYARHDIEYQMWLHEGHIESIKTFPQLLFSAEWQLFDVAVSSRNEGYTVCLDGVNTSTDNNLKYLNNKGLVERDHTTKKDTYYLYKAWWNPAKFVHICGKDYTKKADRKIKCYTNEESLTLYVNNVKQGDAISAVNYIVEFPADTYNAGDVIRVDGPSSTTDTFTF